MALMRDIYDLVSYVDIKIKSEHENFIEVMEKRNKRVVASVSKALREYSDRSEKTYGEVVDIFDSAKSMDYLDSDGVSMGVSHIKGRKILVKKAGIRIGLLNESLETFDTLRAVVLAVILSTVFWAIVAVVFRGIIERIL